MSEVMADAFSIDVYQCLDVYRNPSFQKLFDDFISGVGPLRLFVYYQQPYKINESGEINWYNGPKEFFVSDGEKLKLRDKGIFFARAEGKTPNPNNWNDNDIIFGEISEHAVTSLDIIINRIYKPLVEHLDAGDWGVCEDEQKKEFSSVFDKFANELKEALKSLQSSINLESYDPQWQKEAKNTMTSNKPPNPEMLSDFEKVFNDWTEKILEALEGADAERKDEKGDPR
jgi:hypothetical protein